jgi:hypothetical protein
MYLRSFHQIRKVKHTVEVMSTCIFHISHHLMSYDTVLFRILRLLVVLILNRSLNAIATSRPLFQSCLSRKRSGKRFLLFFIIISVVRLIPLGTASTTGLLYHRQMIDDGDCGAVCGMQIGRGSRSARRKPTPAPFCPPQIPHDQTCTRTRAAAVGSQRLTAWRKRLLTKRVT